MAEHFAEGVTSCDSAGNGEGQGDADQKRKRRLDKIVQGATDPFDVRLLVREERPQFAFRKIARYAAEMQHFGDHEKHHEAAIRVHGDEALRRGRDL